MRTYLLQAVAQTATDQNMDFFSLAVKGGWLMIPLLLLSILGVYIFIERFLAIKKAGVVDPNFMQNIREHMIQGRVDAALAQCQASNTPISRMIEKGIKRIGRPLNDIQAAIENVGNLEVARLEKGITILATISGGAPMIGFLGTVLGMVEAFFRMSTAGNNLDVSILSGGIYVAMITTVGGLIVGIPALFGYNYLVSYINKVIFNMEANTSEFMDLLYVTQKEK